MVHKAGALFALGLFLAACGPRTTMSPRSSSTPELPAEAASPVVSRSTAALGQSLFYKTIYRAGEFEIREALWTPRKPVCWDSEAQNWDPPLPGARIPKPATELGFRDSWDVCYGQLETNTWCTQIVTLSTADGREITFELMSNGLMSGQFILKKNGRLLWEGDLNGGTCIPVLSSKRIGDEVAVEVAVPVLDAQGEMSDIALSVILTDHDRAVDVRSTTGYDRAFAPNGIEGKLAFFALSNGKRFLVFDGKEVGEKYDKVYDQYCCWDGPPIQVYGDTKIVDFFGERDGILYHVQAGNLSHLK